MNIWEFLKEKLFGRVSTDRTTSSKSIRNTGDWEEWINQYQTCEAQRIALYAATRLIGSTLSQCPVRTFIKGEEVQGGDWYKFNFRPGKNTTSVDFWQTLVTKLYLRGEALVLNLGSSFDPNYVIADNFTHDVRAFAPDLFSEISLRGMDLDRTYNMDEVFYFRLGDQNVKGLVNSMAAQFNQMIALGVEAYEKSQGEWGILKVNSDRSGDEDFEDYVVDLVNKKFRPVMKNGRGIVPLFEGETYENFEGRARGDNTNGSIDARRLTDDVMDLTSRAMGIPIALLQGKVAGTDDAWRLFLSTTIDPIAEQITQELTSKLHSMRDIQAGNLLMMDTSTVDHVGVMSIGAHVDKLISNGVYSVNDIRAKINEPKIDEPWADKHYITLNYSTATDAGENKPEETNEETNQT